MADSVNVRVSDSGKLYPNAVVVKVGDEEIIAGRDGVSPVVTTEAITHGNRVTITDAVGEHVFVVMDGDDGADGVSPAVSFTTITGGHTMTVTDKDHPSGQSINIMDGTSGGGGTSDYDDLTDKPSINGTTLSGNKTAAELGLGTYSKPSGGIPKTDLASAVQTSLGKADTALQSAPVTSVNSKTGAVSLSASDVGALPAGTAIPSKTSDLTNDSGFLTSAPVTSVNNKTGAVTLTAADVGAGTYSKPSGGIPASDLASSVQTSLGLADSALQSVPSTYRTAAAQDAIDAAQDSNIATIESSPATAAHAVGEYIVLNGQLYKVTAAISAGQTLTVGTNIESTNVANIIQNYSVTTIIDNYNGYVKFDSGLLMQWGRTLYTGGIEANSTVTTTVQLNTPFSATAYSSNVSLHTSYPNLRSISVYSQTVNGMTITLGNSSSSAATSTVFIYWLCIGFWK